MWQEHRIASKWLQFDLVVEDGGACDRRLPVGFLG